MAKTVDTKKEKKAKAPDFKDSLYEIAGQALANALNTDVFRIKVEGMPECLILTNDQGVDFTFSITQKKTNVDYDETDHVKATFTPAEAEAEAEDEATDGENA